MSPQKISIALYHNSKGRFQTCPYKLYYSSADNLYTITGLNQAHWNLIERIDTCELSTEVEADKNHWLMRIICKVRSHSVDKLNAVIPAISPITAFGDRLKRESGLCLRENGEP
jgi:hypothetical protein